MAYTLISSATISSQTASYAFTSIPGTYRDLLVVVKGIGSGTFRFQYNSNSSDYAFQIMENGGTTAQASWFSSQSQANCGQIGPSNRYFQSIIQTFDYAQTNKHKVYLCRSNSYTGVMAVSGRWGNTAAVTTFTLLGNVWLNAGTVIELYGLTG